MMGQVEFDTVVIPLDGDVQAALEAKAREGWMLVPGIKPLGIWQVCRQPGVTFAQPAAGNMMESGGPKVTLTVDPSKVGILRNGKFIDEDGNETAPPG